MALLDDIAGLVGDALSDAGMARDATLIVSTLGDRDPDNLSAGRAITNTSYAAKGLVVAWKKQYLNATLVKSTDRVVMLLGSTIADGIEPSIDNRITIEGLTSRIVDIARDPAAATYNCLTRK